MKIIIICILGIGLLSGCALVDPGDLPITQPLVILQDYTMVMAFAVVLIEARWMLEVYKLKQSWRVLFGVGTVLTGLHITVYYVVVLLFRAEVFHYPGMEEIIFLTDWSAIVKAQFVTFLLISEALRLWDTLLISKSVKALDIMTHGDHP